MNKKMFSDCVMPKALFQSSLMAVMLGVSSGATSAVIDSFTVAQPHIQDNTTADGAVSISAGDGSEVSILGGARDTSIDLLSGYLPAKLDIVDSVGYFVMSVDSTSNGIGIVQWDGVDNSINLNTTGLAGVDLTGNGAFNALSISTVFADLDHEMTIGIYTDATHWTEITYAVAATDVSVTDTYRFSNFMLADRCGTTIPEQNIVAIVCGDQPADPSNIGALQLVVNPDGATPELDLVLQVIEPTFIDVQECTSSVGNVIWHDLNRDGIQDANEEGINGVTVNLKNADDVILATTATDLVNGTSGYYEFKNLCANDYTVEVDETTLSPDFVASPTNQGADEALDSNDNPTVVSLADNESNLTLDFGYNSPCTGSIGNYIWFDENRDGLQDASEAGIEGVTVDLKDAAGNVIATTVTDVDGLYEFAGLCADDYIVEVRTSTLTPEYVASLTEEGSDNTVDSNPNGSLVTLDTDTSTDSTIDFGYNSPCAGVIGNYVWFDANRNGLQDADEAGIAGVTVKLKTALNIVIATATTDASGFYKFDGLCADDYRVEVDTATVPVDYIASPVLEGSDDTIDSNESDSTVNLTTDVAEDLSIDFGYNSPCTGNIGNYVWLDLNQDGIQDFNESGISGVTVNLKDDQNTVIATAVTNEFGFYEFLGFCAGNYIVEVDPTTLPTGLVPTVSEVGFNGEIDSNSNSANVTLSGDFDSDITIDFGYFENLIPDVNCQVCDGKVTALTLRYTGTEAAMIVVSQKKGGDVFNAEVQPGEEFSFLGTEKFGTLGTVIDISVDGVQTISMHTSCSVEIGPGYVDGDFEVTEAHSRNGGLMCPVEASAPINDDCQVCDGKVTALTLRYTGTEAAMIVVTQKKGGEVFNALVQPGDDFSFSGTERFDTLGTVINISVNGVKATSMHTSCSVEIGPGYVDGDFEVTEAYSRNGGLMCAV